MCTVQLHMHVYLNPLLLVYFTLAYENSLETIWESNVYHFILIINVTFHSEPFLMTWLSRVF